VVALGGGALVDANLRAEVLGRGLVVRLFAPAAVLAARLAPSAERPLLGSGPDQAAALRRLLADRAAAYRAGHLGVDASGAPEQAAEKVCARVAAGVVPLFVPPSAYGAWLAQDEAARALGDVLGGCAPSSVHVVADATVNDLFGAELLDALPIRPRSLHLVGPGEGAKTFAVLERVAAELLEAGIDRDSVVVGLGGGATTDLAGLAAALLARGVRWIAVPTTLLAMVDAAVGGKTAINLGSIKNPVGAFHHPAAVVIDPSLTRSEPDRTFRAAMAELVKTALIGDAALFEEIEARPRALLDRSPAALLDAVRRAVRVKARVVVQDPDEQGLRAVLNLGHTVGHAIEAASAGEISHGEAVAMGLEAALAIGVDQGVTPPDVQTRVVRTLRALELPPLRSFDAEVTRRVQFDKKRRGTAVQMVLLRGVGCAEVIPISLEALLSNLRKLGPLVGVP
jgi:shikimate kinase/3-dehydroquinate synthase